MSGATNDNGTIKATGRGNAFDDIYDEATARRDPQPAPAQSPATAQPGPRETDTAPAWDRPARQPRPARTPADRQARSLVTDAIPMPPVLDSGTTKPLNVRAPATVHFALKLATLSVATNIQAVVNHLVTIFLEDPELIMKLVAEAESDDQTLGRFVHDALANLAGD